MRGPSRAVRGLLLAGAAGLTLVVIALGACSKRLTAVDPSYTVPEGRYSPDAQLIVWYEAPTETLIYLDRPPIGAGLDAFCGFIKPGDGDSLIRRGKAWRFSPGTVNGVILDGTQATQYEVLRRESGGGFRVLQDFPALPQRRWPNEKYEEYVFADPAPSGSETYVGRGRIAGTVSRESPLTNPGIVTRPTSTDTMIDIHYTGFCNPCDSLFLLKWDPVPGATRYWMQVYRASAPSTSQELLQASAPAPVNNHKTRDIFFGYMDAPATSYKLGSAQPNVRVLIQRSFDYISPYFVRVSAVDASGRLIAMTRGDFARIPGEGRYTLFRMGAVIVAPNSTRGRCRQDPGP